LNELCLHIFGGRQGESILLKLPDGRWGMIDHFTWQGRSPALNLLKDNKVTTLAFLALTHPHVDHYRGIDKVMTEMDVDRLWFPDVMTPEDVAEMLGREIVDTENVGPRQRDRKALRAFLKEFRQRNAHKKRTMSESREMYKNLTGSESEFTIKSLSPSDSARQTFQNALKALSQNDRGKILVHGSTSDPNHISAVLQIRYGTTSILLAADLLNKGWDILLTSPNSTKPELKSHFVKVPHHGSTTAFSSKLWGEFSPTETVTACVTAYARHKIPELETLKAIQNQCASLDTPSIQGVEGAIGKPLLATQRSPNPLPLEMSFARDFGKKKDFESPTHGRCSYVFNERGLQSHSFHGPAGNLPHIA